MIFIIQTILTSAIHDYTVSAISENGKSVTHIYVPSDIQECLWHSCWGGARHASYDIFFCAPLQSVEAISDGRLNPATNTSLLPHAYSGSHLPSRYKMAEQTFQLVLPFLYKANICNPLFCFIFYPSKTQKAPCCLNQSLFCQGNAVLFNSSSNPFL